MSDPINIKSWIDDTLSYGLAKESAFIPFNHAFHYFSIYPAEHCTGVVTRSSAKMHRSFFLSNILSTKSEGLVIAS
jgi:hypothetical protein